MHLQSWHKISGRLIIDGEEQPLSLMKLIKKTQTDTQPNNSIIAFHDNSSAIQGSLVKVLVPEAPEKSSQFIVKEVSCLSYCLSVHTVVCIWLLNFILNFFFSVILCIGWFMMIPLFFYFCALI